MNDKTLKRKINLLAKNVGVKINWRKSLNNFGSTLQYDGKYITGDNFSNIIHDIAHFEVADKKARSLPDFGLGEGPDSYDFNGDCKRIYSEQKCDQIEERASALGIFWEKEIGLDWKFTLNYHNWSSESELYKILGKIPSSSKLKYKISE